MLVDTNVLQVDAEVHSAGRLRARREEKGRLVAQAEVLIAASALGRGVTLVTRNVSTSRAVKLPCSIRP